MDELLAWFLVSFVLCAALFALVCRAVVSLLPSNARMLALTLVAPLVVLPLLFVAGVLAVIVSGFGGSPS
jgi:hypothetical protein